MRDNNRLVLALLMVAFAGLAVWLLQHDAARNPARPGVDAPASADGYLFCSWNVENLYDDDDDPRNHDADEDWFAAHPEAVGEKVRLLADALLKQNDGKGPDILAIVEVESLRAAELLRDALNERLPSESRYQNLVFKPNETGRRIAPAVITRLAVRDDLTRSYTPRRILEVHLEAQGAPLTVLASHWTSRLRGDTEAKREAYADALYARVLELSRTDPECDVLIAGDFNDEPDDPSLTDHLHVLGDPDQVRQKFDRDRTYNLLDLTERLDPRTDGTYFYHGKWEILDHIVANPGLLNPAGWSVAPGTIHTENRAELRYGRDRRPWRFGNPQNTGPRGPSDHFALTVRLQVQP